MTHRVPKCKQEGVALALVVWFIAGMSLLVAGIVSHARVDSRMIFQDAGIGKGKLDFADSI